MNNCREKGLSAGIVDQLKVAIISLCLLILLFKNCAGFDAVRNKYETDPVYYGNV
jgi:hypothetical protein